MSPELGLVRLIALRGVRRRRPPPELVLEARDSLDAFRPGPDRPSVAWIVSGWPVAPPDARSTGENFGRDSWTLPAEEDDLDGARVPRPRSERHADRGVPPAW